MHLTKPCLIYNGYGTHIFPDQPNDIPMPEPRNVERHDSISANKRKLSYFVGVAEFIECQFMWQDDTLKAEWDLFFVAVEDGSEFYYLEDDDVPRVNTGLVNTMVVGEDSGGTTHAAVKVTLENTDGLAMERGEVYGYWQTPVMRLRKVV